ncbi:hypothetical protein Y699_01681 [Aspergillus fumigatus Z5]|nr:hypothetical protein Y699_01681 [Aspergillus fumigatus Z5]
MLQQSASHHAVCINFSKKGPARRKILCPMPPLLWTASDGHPILESILLKKVQLLKSESCTSHQSLNNKRKARANPEDSQLLISSYFPLRSLEDEARIQGFEMEASSTLLRSSPNLQQQSPADCSVRNIALKRHVAVAVQSQADQPNHSGAYNPDVHRCELSLSSTPTSISYHEHAAFLSESWSEIHIRQLLHFDLSSQDKVKDESTHPVRKYWSLEDLKLLLQGRDKFRQQATEPQVVSEWSFSDAPDKGPKDEPDFKHTSDTPLARPRKTTLANRSNAGSKEDFDSGSDTVKCPEHPTKSQDERFFSSVFQAGSFEQEANLQPASGAGRDEFDDDMVIFSAEEAQLQDDIMIALPHRRSMRQHMTRSCI